MVPKESPSCIVYSVIIIFEFAQQLRTLGPLKARVVCVLSTNSAAVIGILEVEKKIHCAPDLAMGSSKSVN